MPRGRIESENEVRRLEFQVAISTEQLATVEKEVERKANDADSVGRNSISMQMAKADVDNIEQILHAVAVERETLRIELKARPRVRVLWGSECPGGRAGMPRLIAASVLGEFVCGA